MRIGRSSLRSGSVQLIASPRSGFDITPLAFKWYDSTNTGAGGNYANYGFVLMPTGESSAVSYVTFVDPR